MRLRRVELTPPAGGLVVIAIAVMLCLADGLLGWSLAGVLTGVVFGTWR